MARSVFMSLVLAAAITAAQTLPAAAECMALAAPQIANCKPVNVSAIAKSYLDLYRIEGGKPVFDRTLQKSNICLPFRATDCGVPVVNDSPIPLPSWMLTAPDAPASDPSWLARWGALLSELFDEEQPRTLSAPPTAKKRRRRNIN